MSEVAEKIPTQQPKLEINASRHFTSWLAEQKLSLAFTAAYTSGGYSQKEIADYFNLHYSSVSKIIRQYERAKKELI